MRLVSTEPKAIPRQTTTVSPPFQLGGCYKCGGDLSLNNIETPPEWECIQCAWHKPLRLRPYLTVAEAAEYAGVLVDLMRQWLANGEIYWDRLAVSRKVIDEFLQERQRKRQERSV